MHENLKAHFEALMRLAEAASTPREPKVRIVFRQQLDGNGEPVYRPWKQGDYISNGGGVERAAGDGQPSAEAYIFDRIEEVVPAGPRKTRTFEVALPLIEGEGLAVRNPMEGELFVSPGGGIVRAGNDLDEPYVILTCYRIEVLA